MFMLGLLHQTPFKVWIMSIIIFFYFPNVHIVSCILFINDVTQGGPGLVSTHIKNCLNFGIAQKGGGVQGLPKLFWALFLLRGELFGFYPRPLWSVGLQMDIFSSLFLHTSNFLFLPGQKKAQVLFLSSWEKLKYLFLLGTENAVGGCGSLAVYAIVFFFYRCTTGVLCVISLQFICFSLNKHGIDI